MSFSNKKITAEDLQVSGALSGLSGIAGATGPTGATGGVGPTGATGGATASASAPASATAAGAAGTIAYDPGFIYVCVATNTWVRAAVATW